MADSCKRFKTHECVSELWRCAFCQVEQAAESNSEDLIQKPKGKWQASLKILNDEVLLFLFF
jgi:hypothetical protein